MSRWFGSVLLSASEIAGDGTTQKNKFSKDGRNWYVFTAKIKSLCSTLASKICVFPFYTFFRYFFFRTGRHVIYKKNGEHCGVFLQPDLQPHEVLTYDYALVLKTPAEGLTSDVVFRTTSEFFATFSFVPTDHTLPHPSPAFPNFS